jgi:hypothetical protein
LDNAPAKSIFSGQSLNNIAEGCKLKKMKTGIDAGQNDTQGCASADE